MALPTETQIAWGYTLQDYQQVFGLVDDDITKRLLDCVPGPSSFNLEMTHSGGEVVSIDPLYGAMHEEIDDFLTETKPQLMRHLSQVVQRSEYSLEILASKHQRATEMFLADFIKGRQQGRYRDDTLPFLPFADEEFDLALCNNYLFSKAAELSETFHIAALLELCRVAKEVRIFPLCTEGGDVPTFLGNVLSVIQKEGFGVEIRQANYSIGKGHSAMLRLWPVFCPLQAEPIPIKAEGSLATMNYPERAAQSLP